MSACPHASSSEEAGHRLGAMGLVCSLGDSAAQVWAGVLAGERRDLQMWHDRVPGRAVCVAPVTRPLPTPPPGLQAHASRVAALLLAAYPGVASEVARQQARHGAHRVGVVLGSSTSGIERGEAAMAARAAAIGCGAADAAGRAGAAGWLPADYRYTQQEMGAPALFLAAYAGCRGPAVTISTACSSSAKVFATALGLLAIDACDAVLVGGADTLCGLTLNGFAALDALSAGPCNPFSRHRDGIHIGEGAALFVLSRDPGGVRLLGVGEASDAHHMSAPDPTGGGAIRAMRRALDAAGLAPEDIDYVNLHGTATPLNDAMESAAMHAVFGPRPPCSSTKALHGHTLGAAGALELAICWLMLHPPEPPGVSPAAPPLPSPVPMPPVLDLPPHIWDGVADPDLLPLDLVAPGRRLPVTRRRVCAMSNSFAFGGSNCSVVIGRHREAI